MNKSNYSENYHLVTKIKEAIKANGPISLDQYMSMVLYDVKYGYYSNLCNIGGDFTTAPEISQLFGEAIALFQINHWLKGGAQANVTLIELGPGNGTLMQDLVRVWKSITDANINVVMVEVSSHLQNKQRQALSGAGVNVSWVKDIGDYGARECSAAYIIGNEFLDALPIKQFIKQGDIWGETCIALNNAGELVTICDQSRGVDSGFGVCFTRGTRVIEYPPKLFSLIEGLLRCLGSHKHGVLTFIDYGIIDGEVVAPSGSVQAIHSNTKVDFLYRPGFSDITYLVNFPMLRDVIFNFKWGGVHINKPITQREFLLRNGIVERLRQLAFCNKARHAELQEGVDRLINPKRMGSLFKVLNVFSS